MKANDTMAVNAKTFCKVAKNIRRLIDHIRKEKSLSEKLAKETFDQIDDLVNEALIAKPRNCDMPLVVNVSADNNADKAWLVFKHHNPDAYFDVPGLLRCIDWLLAPATERKGESDGSK